MVKKPQFHIRLQTIQCVKIEDENRGLSIVKPGQSIKRQSRIGIEDFGELVRTDTNQTHDFFYDIVFSEQ